MPKKVTVNAGTASVRERTTKKKTLTKRVLLILLAIGLLLVLVGVKYRYLFTPASINGRPIYIWTFWSAVVDGVGKQVLEQLVTERLIIEEASKQNVVVTKEEISGEVKNLEERFSQQQGGLEGFLASQGMTRVELEKQIELNLKLEKLVADKVQVTDEEVDTYYTENKESYSSVEKDEAVKQIRELLTNQKLQSAVSEYLANLRQQAQVKIYLPGVSSN